MDNELIMTMVKFFIAVIPSVALCAYIYFKDKVEKEPLKLLITLFFLGIIITIPVYFVEQFLITTFNLWERTPLKIFILSFVAISLVEEGFKYLITFLGIWKNKKFNYIYDGVVYAAFVSLGFALFENILYVMNNPFNVGIQRAILSVPAHGFFSIISGYFLGLAKFNKFIGYKKYKNRFLIFSFALPVLLHGFFDFLLFLNHENSLIVFYIFVVFMYIVSFLLIKKVYHTEMTTPME